MDIQLLIPTVVVLTPIQAHSDELGVQNWILQGCNSTFLPRMPHQREEVDVLKFALDMKRYQRVSSTQQNAPAYSDAHSPSRYSYASDLHYSPLNNWLNYLSQNLGSIASISKPSDHCKSVIEKFVLLQCWLYSLFRYWSTICDT